MRSPVYEGMDSTDLPDTLVGRYLAGELTSAEREAFERRLDAVRGLRADVELLHRAWTETSVSPAMAGRVESLWTRISDRLQEYGPEGSLQGRRFTQSRTTAGNRRERGGGGSQTLRAGVWFGAMATLIVGASILAHGSRVEHAYAMQTYATHLYQQAIVNLDDGTRITLAPQTTVRVMRFSARSRTIELDSGEAYFEVMHASASPFMVRSGATTAQVLGTAFLVRHDAGDAHVRVSVTDGKVRVMTAARPAGVTLTVGQTGDVTDSTTQVSTTNDLTPGIEWASGRIMFRHIPLTTVLHTVEKWYGYHFRYSDRTLGTQSVTMMISTRSSAEALATIEHMLAVNLTVVGDTITLVPQPEPSIHHAPRIRTYDVWTPKNEVGR